MSKQYVLLVDVKKGETLDIGGVIVVRVEEKSGQRARLRFTFKEPTEVKKIQTPAAQPAPA
jgi:hypothetical protein